MRLIQNAFGVVGGISLTTMLVLLVLFVGILTTVVSLTPVVGLTTLLVG